MKLLLKVTIFLLLPLIILTKSVLLVVFKLFLCKQFQSLSNHCNSNYFVIPSFYPVIPCEQSPTNKANIKIYTSFPISNTSSSCNSSSYFTYLETLSKKLLKELVEYIDAFNQTIAKALPLTDFTVIFNFNLTIVNSIMVIYTLLLPKNLMLLKNTLKRTLLKDYKKIEISSWHSGSLRKKEWKTLYDYRVIDYRG